ncbi:hypothetical protein QEJ31_05885 [Pigmentibacter sp. JX0631]|uniref:hypothetical protein n=1 Tax=Pigmentibacter sp. JX0631 TaxID=2976982 RepID=UPI00246850EB|nr:hypothetical protein [Pigmentibacter sp. JX0631]WGL61125.1 hypothetical protein QEJ31_05885 [Pigmentibacter sp. JX0631]
MKNNIILVFAAFFLNATVFAKETNSYAVFLPKSFQDYHAFEKVKNNKENDQKNIKERYHTIKGDLNIFPTQDLIQVKKVLKPNHNMKNKCLFPTTINNYYENSYNLKRNDKLDEFVNRVIQQIEVVNDRYFQVVDGQKSNYIYNSDNDIEICPPSNPYHLENMRK